MTAKASGRKPRICDAPSGACLPRSACPVLVFLLLAAALAAQETSLETSLGELPGLRERAVVLHIVSRIVEQNQEVWNYKHSRITIPGRPVGLKLIGSNLLVTVQFTPFLQVNDRHVLVAQGQIWINIPDEGMRFHTTMQTIPLEFSEEVYFFPLGPTETQDEARIEVQLMMEPYSGTEADDAPGRRGRDAPPSGANNAPGRQGRISPPPAGRASPPEEPSSAITDNTGNETPP